MEGQEKTDDFTVVLWRLRAGLSWGGGSVPSPSSFLKDLAFSSGRFLSPLCVLWNGAATWTPLAESPLHTFRFVVKMNQGLLFRACYSQYLIHQSGISDLWSVSSLCCRLQLVTSWDYSDFSCLENEVSTGFKAVLNLLSIPQRFVYNGYNSLMNRFEGSNLDYFL